MTRSTLPSLALVGLLLLGGEAASAGDTFALSGSTLWGKSATGVLALDDGLASLSLTVGDESLCLAGDLSPRGVRYVGTLSSNRGLAGGLEQGGEGERWGATLDHDGPLVRLRLTRGLTAITLEGLAHLGAQSAANEALIRTFYEAFARGDGDTMAACYAPDARFTDPVFPDLRDGAQGDMWRMLCESKPKIVFSGIHADDHYAVAHWEADYELFGNKVHNVIDARFELRDGKIVRHVDQFDFARWARQAFGPLIRIVPSGAVRHVVRGISAAQLRKFRKQRAG